VEELNEMILLQSACRIQSYIQNITRFQAGKGKTAKKDISSAEDHTEFGG
jgi:hypothetical protein